MENSWLSRDDAMKSLRHEATWSDKGLCEHDIESNTKFNSQSMTNSQSSVDSDSTNSNSSAISKPSRQRRMQRRLAAIAKAKSALDIEITSAVLEHCLSVLVQPQHVSCLMPTLAAETMNVLEDLYHKGNPKYRQSIWEISSGLMENISVALDMNGRAEQA